MKDRLRGIRMRLSRLIAGPCDHKETIADIMEGARLPYRVTWCRECGRIGVVIDRQDGGASYWPGRDPMRATGKDFA